LEGIATPTSSDTKITQVPSEDSGWIVKSRKKSSSSRRAVGNRDVIDDSARCTSWEVPFLQNTGKDSGSDSEVVSKSASGVHLKQRRQGTQSETDHASKLRSALALLNKLSDQNEARIEDQLARLQPKNAEEMGAFADLMLEQALKDPMRAELYGRTIVNLNAKFPSFLLACSETSSETTSSSGSATPRPVTLEAEVTRICQIKFEALCRELQDCRSLGNGETSESIEAMHLKRKDRSMACVVVISKLVCCKVLSVRVLGHVVVELLQSKKVTYSAQNHGSVGTEVILPSESYIECACQMLSGVRGRLKGESVQALACIYRRLAWLRDARLKDIRRVTLTMADDFVYAPRIRYLILDLLEAGAPDEIRQPPVREERRLRA